MEAMRSTWTDSRLDDLNKRVDWIHDDFRDLRKEMRTEFQAVRGEIGDLKRTMIQLGRGLIGTLVIGMLGLIGTQL